MDIRVFGNDIPEVSLTEVVQESVLAVIVLVHFLLARNYPHLRYSNILIGGFFLAMLIRELDGLFDLLSHGSWVWFALLATAGRCWRRCAICVRPCRSWRLIPARPITA